MTFAPRGLPAAVAARGAQIAQGWSGSLTMGAGQFCTNPGIAVVMEDQAQGLAEAVLAALAAVGAQVMLTEGIARAYVAGRDRVAGTPGVQSLLTQVCDRRQATPQVFKVRGADWLADHSLGEEVFGPLGLIVTAKDAEEMLAIAQSLQGQLTCTLHLDEADTTLPSQYKLRGNFGGNAVDPAVPAPCQLSEHPGGAVAHGFRSLIPQDHIPPSCGLGSINLGY